MIEFVKYENKRIYYRNNSNNIIPAIIEFYDYYTNSFMFSNELELHPNGEYFTYIPYLWNIFEVYIYNKNNKELIFYRKMKGDKKLNHYDDYGYLLRLFQIEKNKIVQSSLYQIIGEHFYFKEYENFIDIEDNDIIFDIGFNYGIFSLKSLYKNASMVYGFEPDLDVYNKIKNIYPERDRVKLFNYAVSDQNKKVMFYVTKDTVASTITTPKKDYKEYEVECINLYDFILKNEISRIDFLKIDCEGEEYKIFESIPDDFFSKIRKILVEFHLNDGIIINKLTDKLNRLNFKWQFSSNADYNSELGLIYAKKDW